MAVVSGLFYLLFVVFFAYPKPITERPKEYGFAVLLILTIYCAIVLVIYTILNLSQEIEKDWKKPSSRTNSALTA